MSRLSFMGVLLCAVPLVQAQTAPDAGSTLRQLQEAPLDVPRLPDRNLRIEPEKPVAAPEAGIRFPVTGFRFSGNTVLAESQFQALLADLINKELSLADLREASQRVSRLYREQGYLVARAYLPPQEIKNGVVAMAVIEGRYGTTGLKNNSLVKDTVLRGYLEKVTDEKIVRQQELDRGLLLIAGLSGVKSLNATLKPGAVAGETALEVEASQTKAVKGVAELDNYGNRFTGQPRLKISLNLISPSGNGDEVGLNGVTTGQNLNSLRLTYQLPIGVNGFKLGAGYNESRYRLGGRFAVLDGSGSSRAVNVNGVYPFILAQNFNLFGQLSLEKKQLQDRIGALSSVTDKQSDLYSIAMHGDARDAFGGGGLSIFGLTYATGDLDIETAAVRLADAATARTQGRFNKLNFSLTRLQRLTDFSQFYFYANGQLASKNLDSSEKISLGGANGVRAYPQGEASGDEGYLATTELRYNLQLAGVTPLWQLVSFVDVGGIRINRNPFSPGENTRQLSAIGLGVNVFKNDDYELRFSWAWKLRPEPTLSDDDRGGLGWVRMVKYF